MRLTTAVTLAALIGLGFGLTLGGLWLPNSSTALPSVAIMPSVPPSPTVHPFPTPSPDGALPVVLIATNTPMPTWTPDPAMDLLLTPHVSMSTPLPTPPPGIAPTSMAMPGQSSR